MISGFHREVDVNCALLGCYATISGNFLPTFRDNLSVPFSGSKNPISLQESIILSFDSWLLKFGPIGCPETSAINYHYLQRDNPAKCNSQNTSQFEWTFYRFLWSLFHIDLLQILSYLLYYTLIYFHKEWKKEGRQAVSVCMSGGSTCGYVAVQPDRCKVGRVSQNMIQII